MNAEQATAHLGPMSIARHSGTKDTGRGTDEGPSTLDEGPAATRKQKLLSAAAITSSSHNTFLIRVLRRYFSSNTYAQRTFDGLFGVDIPAARVRGGELRHRRDVGCAVPRRRPQLAVRHPDGDGVADVAVERAHASLRKRVVPDAHALVVEQLCRALARKRRRKLRRRIVADRRVLLHLDHDRVQRRVARSPSMCVRPFSWKVTPPARFVTFRFEPSASVMTRSPDSRYTPASA